MKSFFPTLLLGLAVGLAPAAVQAEPMLGLAITGTTNADSALVTFDSETPRLTSFRYIRGLVGSSAEYPEGIDLRPADGALVVVTRERFGVDDGRGRVYTVNLGTAAATLISGANGLRDAANDEVRLAPPSGTPPYGYGVDIDPVTNALRIISSTDQNLRITLGGAGVTSILTPLSGPAVGDNPNVGAIAYSNNFAGATSTTLYALDQGAGRLRTIGGFGGIPSPDLGRVFDVGATPPYPSEICGINGFDISSTTGIAYALVQACIPFTSVSRLYAVDLTTGGLTGLGQIDVPFGVYDVTVVPEPSSVLLLVTGMAALGGIVLRQRRGRAG